MSKTKILLIISFALLFNTFLSAATSVNVFNTGDNSQYLEAETTLNQVLHLTINTTTSDDLTSISVKNTLGGWGYSPALEPGSISSGSVKVWYTSTDAVDFEHCVSPIYVTTLTVSGGNTWSNVLSTSFPVVNGSALWITVDFQTYPDFGVVQFQTNGLYFTSGPVSSVNEPSFPPVLLVTQSTPAKNLEVSNSSGNMQPEVSTDQEGIIATKLYFYNNSGSTSAPATISSISFTIEDLIPPELPPTWYISSIKIQDANLGTTYGELASPSIPSFAAPFNVPVAIDVPPGSTITANVIITITDSSSYNPSNFHIVIPDAASIDCMDSYTHKKVSIYAQAPAAFPINSNFSIIKKKATSAVMSFDGTIIPSNIDKGQTNVPLALLVFTNAGDTNTANEAIYSIKLTVKDSGGNPIIPRDLFSKITVVNGSGAPITYGQKLGNTIENSGNSITIPLSYPIPVQPPPIGSPAYVSIKADISPTSLVNDFKICIEYMSNIQARDNNSFTSVPVSLSPTSSLPLNSSLAILSSSFKASVTPLMPSNIYKGQTDLPLMNINLSTPLVFGGGNLIVKGITLTAKDAAGTAVNFSTLFSSLSITGAHWSAVYPVMPDLSTFYMVFPDSITLSAANLTETINIKGTLNSLAPAQSIQIAITSPSSISCYQDNEPGRVIYITTFAGSSFPLSSGIGYISSENTDTAFTTYPNPFKSGSIAKIAYHLTESSTVTIKIFTLNGSLVKTIISETLKSAGSHEEDFWSGVDKSNHTVTAGTYMTRIEVKNSSGNKKYSRKITLIK